jgi:hypothetical protein
MNSYSYSNDNPINLSDPQGKTAASLGVEGSIWVFTGSAGITFDQNNVDYDYGYGVAAGVHAGLNAGISTENLSHTSSLSGYGYMSSGYDLGVESGLGMTQYPNSDLKSQASGYVAGGVGFGEAAGERTVVTKPVPGLVWTKPQLPKRALSIQELISQNQTISNQRRPIN